MYEDKKGQEVSEDQGNTTPDSRPIEPQRVEISKLSILKVAIFLLFIGYLLVSNYHSSILTRIGSFLVVEHDPKESDLIVCMAGENVVRGLAVVDAYKRGLGPMIFRAREEPSDGYTLLDQWGIEYPESRDLFISLLEQAGIPRSAVLTSDITTDSTMDEAILVKEIVEEKKIKSIILVTSPTHTRRTWLTFSRVFKENDVHIWIMSSGYSGFDPKDWWKKSKYVREVIFEYQKLVYYWFKLIT